ncbi:hypothetical protein L1D14_20460 [Vibrio tubiashii]|uniref:hypothetical protein n=1 Tax=Vibrio tubiashii TaxID=29498 RepID=UPI001EFC8725|nr:hypothetical protein [Vibrio tubiashii]MCG9578594.1 hypothetical protein [Vibrio tubiashii]
MRNLTMTKFLENVLADNTNRRFGTSDTNNSVYIPLLIKKKSDRNVPMYSTDFGEIANVANLKVSPVRVQLNNMTRGAMLYSVYSCARLHDLDLTGLNTAINEFYTGKGELQPFSSELASRVNEQWKDLTNHPDIGGDIRKQALDLVNAGLQEMVNRNELTQAKVNTTHAQKAVELFLESYQAGVMHDKNISLSRDREISAVFNNLQETAKEFLVHRFGTSTPELYLRNLLHDQAGAIQPLCDDINVNFSDIVDSIPFRQDGDRPDESNSIPSKVYRDARLNRKNGVRGKISAYLKPDELYGDYGMSHLIVNVILHDGGDNVSNSVILYSHTADPTDGNSRNEFSEYRRDRSKVETYFTQERHEEFLTREKQAEERRANFEEMVREENKRKRLEAIDTYNNELTSVTSADQLLKGYFGQKGLAQLAYENINGLKVNNDGDVWLPLGNVISSELTTDNVEAFQNLIANKPEWAETNKLFEGLGDGYKRKCSVTLGDPSKASVILGAEGVANGLIHLQMAKNKGIDVAVVCGLDVGNLTSALNKVIKEHPTKPVVNLADNDLFNSKGEQRYLKHELESKGIEATNKNVNAGMEKAVEMHQAINLPYLYFDFAKDLEGIDLTNYQQTKKGSDIDDLIGAIAKDLSDKGVDNGHEIAWQTAENIFVDKLTATLKYSVSPHWSVERQHDFGWCPSADNLELERFSDYYHMKESIQSAHKVFQEKYGMTYTVYQSMVHTEHFSTTPAALAEMIVQDKDYEQYEQQLEQHIEQQANHETPVNENSFESEPLTAVDEGIEELLGVIVEEDVNLVNSKIASVERRLTNLQQNMDKYPISQYEERVDKNNGELNRLLEEKARLLNTSANHLKQERASNQYLDRSKGLDNDPLVNGLEDPRADLKFEDIESALPSEPVDKTPSQLLDDVFKQNYDSDEPATKADQDKIAELLIHWAEEETNELDKLIETPLDEPEQHYEAVKTRVASLDGYLKDLGALDQVKESYAQLKSSTVYSKYYEALAMSMNRYESSVDVAISDELRAHIESQPEAEEPEQFEHEGVADIQDISDEYFEHLSNLDANENPSPVSTEQEVDTSHSSLDTQNETMVPLDSEETLDSQSNADAATMDDIETPEHENEVTTTPLEDDVSTHNTHVTTKVVGENEQPSNEASPALEVAGENVPETIDTDANDIEVLAEPTQIVEEDSLLGRAYQNQENAETLANMLSDEQQTGNTYESKLDESTDDIAAGSTVDSSSEQDVTDSTIEVATIKSETTEALGASTKSNSENETNDLAERETGVENRAESPSDVSPVPSDMVALERILTTVLEQVNSTHDRTLDAMMKLTENVLQNQSKVLEQIASLSMQVNNLTQQLALAQGKDIDSVSQEVSSIPENETPAIDADRQKLIDTILAQREQLEEMQGVTKTLEHRLQEQALEPVKPENVAKAFSASTQSSPAPTSGTQYDELVQKLRGDLNTLQNTRYKDIDKEIKLTVHEALKASGGVSLDGIKQNANRELNKINRLMKDVFDNEQRPKGLSVAIAISESMRSKSDSTIPNSAISTYVYSEITGQQQDCYAPASDVVNGKIDAGDYFKQCRQILGDENYIRAMGDEEMQFFEQHQQSGQSMGAQQPTYQVPPMDNLDTVPA